MNKEELFTKLERYFDTLEAKALQSDTYFMERNKLYLEKQDLIKWLESKNQFHYKNGKIEDNYILVSEVLNKVRGD